MKSAACLESNVDYNGNDITAATSTATVAQCQDKCRQLSNCQFFTYLPSAQSCYLKTIKNYQQRTDYVSGPKCCP